MQVRKPDYLTALYSVLHTRRQLPTYYQQALKNLDSVDFSDTAKQQSSLFDDGDTDEAA